MRLPTDSLSLGDTVPLFRHHFEEHPGAEYLVVSFTGLATDPAKPHTGWAQRARLASLPVHRLFVDSQVRPLPDPCLDLPGIGQFVEAARSEIGTAPGKTITCGSSLGATAALDVAARHGFRRAIVGSPVVLVGDYVEDPVIPEMVRSSVARSFDGLAGRDLNRIVTDVVQRAPGPTRIDFFVGDGDHFYPEHLDAVRAAAAANPRVDLRAAIAHDITHADMYRPWSRYLAAILHRLLGLPVVGAADALD